MDAENILRRRHRHRHTDTTRGTEQCFDKNLKNGCWKHTHAHTHSHARTHTHTPRGTEQCFDQGSQELLPNTRTHTYTYTNTYTHTHKRVRAHTRTHLEGLSTASISSLDFAESFAGSNLAWFDPTKETCKEFRNTAETPQRWTKVKIFAQGDLATGL